MIYKYNVLFCKYFYKVIDNFVLVGCVVLALLPANCTSWRTLSLLTLKIKTGE